MGGTRKHYVAVGSGVEPMVVLFQFMGKGHALFAYTTRSSGGARGLLRLEPILRTTDTRSHANGQK
jgi:hypothetical protein